MGRLRVLFIVLAAVTVVLTSCGSAADDVGRALRISSDDAQRMLNTITRETGAEESLIASRIIDDADVIALRGSTFASLLDDMEMRAQQVPIEEVIAGTLCSQLVNAHLTGENPTIDGVFSSLVTSVGRAYANAAYNTGQIDRFINIVSTLQTGDPQQISLLAAQQMYC